MQENPSTSQNIPKIQNPFLKIPSKSKKPKIQKRKFKKSQTHTPISRSDFPSTFPATPLGKNCQGVWLLPSVKLLKILSPEKWVFFGTILLKKYGGGLFFPAHRKHRRKNCFRNFSQQEVIRIFDFSIGKTNYPATSQELDHHSECWKTAVKSSDDKLVPLSFMIPLNNFFRKRVKICLFLVPLFPSWSIFRECHAHFFHNGHDSKSYFLLLPWNSSPFVALRR